MADTETPRTTNNLESEDAVQVSAADVNEQAQPATATPNETPDEATVSGQRDFPALPTKPIIRKFRRPPTKREIIILVCLLALLSAGGAYWWYVRQNASQNNATTQQTPSQNTPAPAQNTTPTPTPLDPLTQKFVTPTTGETWLPTPKKLPDQQFFVKNEVVSEIPEYYEIGKRGENTIIMSVAQVMNDDVRLFEVAPNGKVVYIALPDATITKYDEEEYYAQNMSSKITVDKTTHYDSLSIPETLDVGNGYQLKREQGGGYTYLGNLIREESPQVKTVKQYGGSAIVVSERSDATTQLTSMGYFLQTPLSTRMYMLYEPLERKLDDYTWQRGVDKVSGDSLRPITYGCGIYTAVSRADALTDADVVAAGTSPAGQTVYEAKDNSYVLVTKAFDEYVEFFANVDYDYKYKGISKDEFVRQHGIVFFKDKTGTWFAYARAELRPDGGCAKPVVYLYPTTAQQVAVRVGADVKVSEPLYNPSTGWSVWAQPNGQLTLGGKTYGSLFWEGPGTGVYPAITAGTVVPRSQAVATIQKHLAQQGLNTTEIHDFMAYWVDKIPSKPYVRLTWFNTAQLNALAPLHISPKPNTLIRVFLDMDGLDAPIQLPAQRLQALPRTGFTVVEWGGLSPHKLY